jgi:hypothetical protein
MSEHVRTACSACSDLELHRIEDNEIVPDDWFCRSCTARYPSLILVACVAGAGRGFSLGLRSGVEIRFSAAEVVPAGRFIRVRMTESFGADADNQQYSKLPIPAGDVDVSLDEIAWVCEVTA